MSCRPAGDSAEDKDSGGCCRQHDGISANFAAKPRFLRSAALTSKEHTHSMLKVAIGAGWQDTDIQGHAARAEPDTGKPALAQRGHGAEKD